MSAPIPDRPPPASQSAARRDRPFVLAVAALLVAATAVGLGVAVADRRPARPAMAATGARAPVPADQDQPAAPATDRAAQATAAEGTRAGGGAPAAEGTQAGGDASAANRRAAGVDTAGNAAVLPDGVHHALIRKVDVDGNRVTVDVVQRFVDDAATKAAIEDGRSPEEAEYLIVWLRNENPRLRTLPLAADLRVDFIETCDEEPDRRAVLRRLAANARLGQYFYSLTVRHGSVHALVERQITPAC
jgi:hypothetical protein